MRAPLHPITRAVWRAARDSEGRGIFLDQVERLCGAEANSASVRARLVQMVQRDYLMRLGDKHSPRWIISLNVPDGESAEVGAPPVDTRSALARPFGALQSELFLGRLKAVPVSIWHMASLLAVQP